MLCCFSYQSDDKKNCKIVLRVNFLSFFYFGWERNMNEKKTVFEKIPFDKRMLVFDLADDEKKCENFHF